MSSPDAEHRINEESVATETQQEEQQRQELLEELSRKRPRRSRTVALYTYSSKHDIPSRYRLKLWQSLLGVDPMSQTLLEQRINGVTLNLPNQRVVKMDAQRTRADLPMFECEETRERIQRILTYYCKNREVEYKQGMNEVLAPIVMAALLERKCMEDGVDEVFDRTVDSKLRTIGSNEAKTLMTSGSNAIVYQLFERMLSKFLTRIFGTDDEFISLQCSLRLFRLLLQYHAPDLCLFLDQYDLPPELYATPWFFTLFAHTLTPNLLMPLLDFLIFHATGRDTDGTRTVENLLGNETDHSPCGPEMLHFVAVAFLISNRNEILHSYKTHDERAPAELPMLLRNLMFKDRQHLENVCQEASRLYTTTPVTFRNQLFDICYGKSDPSSQALLDRLESRICIKITVDELLEAESKRGASAAKVDNSDILNSPQFFIVDCRYPSEFKQGHLPTCFHFDPHTFEDAEHLDNLIVQLEGLKGLHVAILGAGDSSKMYSRPSKSANPYNMEEGKQSDDGASLENEDGASELLKETNSQEDEHQEAHMKGTLMDRAKRMKKKLKNRKNKHRPHQLVTTSANEDDDYAEDDLTRHLVLFFLQRGFPYVSEVQGGYTALYQHQSSAVKNLLITAESEDHPKRSRAKSEASQPSSTERSATIHRKISTALKSAIKNPSKNSQPIVTSASAYCESLVESQEENLVAPENPKDREQLIRVWMRPQSQSSAEVDLSTLEVSADSSEKCRQRSQTVGSSNSLHEARRLSSMLNKKATIANKRRNSHNFEDNDASVAVRQERQLSNEEFLLDVQLDEIESQQSFNNL